MNNHCCLKCHHKFKKRINNDIKLFDNYNNLILDKIQEKNVDKIYFLFIYLKINKIKYLFKLKYDYPLSPPNILIKIDNLYVDYYQHIFKLYTFYNNKINIDDVACPCCFNLLCNYNLTYKLIHFVDEILNYNDLIIRLNNKYIGLLLLNKKNNLNDNINNYIIEYL